jgi:hypothetical protein
VAARIREHNEVFLRSYWRFFDSIYRDKYFYMGEHDLLSASFLIETAQYYIFVVIPAYRVMGKFHWMPVLGPKPAFFSYHLMRIYNRRFKKIALARREMGEAGARNDGRRVKAFFNLGFAPLRMAGRGLRIWMAAEADLLRLRVKRLFAGKPAAALPAPEEAVVEDS